MPPKQAEAGASKTETRSGATRASVGIRELKQNASAVVRQVVEHGDVTVTDRGRPVALLCALSGSRLEELVRTGRARLPKTPEALPRPLPPPDPGAPTLSQTLEQMRDGERY